MVSFVESVVSTFVGKGSLSDFGDRYPDLDGNNMSSVAGLYVIGNVSGTPDIRAALNAGSDLGRFMERGDGLPPDRNPCDFDVVVIGAGPAGLACAAVLAKTTKNVVVLERKKALATIRAFDSELELYDAVTGDRGNRSCFEYSDCKAGELLEKWEAQLQELQLPIREGIGVKDVAKRSGQFFLELTDGTTITAQRVVLAVGKLIFLDKLKAGEDKLDCRLKENSIGKAMEPSTSAQCTIIDRTGIRRERELDLRGITRLGLWIAAVVGIYCWLYYGSYNDKGEHIIPYTDWSLPGWFIYSTAYTLAVVGFGIKAILRWRHPLQTKKFLSLMACQALLFWAIPIYAFTKIQKFSSPSGGWELGYIWPLAIKPENTEQWFNSGGWAFYMFTWNMILSFILIPIFTIKHGKKYCSWICGCGGLAETLGDSWRQYSPKGKLNEGREKMGLWVTGFAVLATVVVFLNMAFPSELLVSVGRDGEPIIQEGLFEQAAHWGTFLYKSIVDIWLIGIIPVALYPFLGGKLWCRFWCPSAVYMQLMSKFWAVFKRKRHAEARKADPYMPELPETYAIHSRKERCIACNMCTRYCEIGIDVRRFAIKGTVLDNTNSSCIGCAICISVCPTETLSFDPTFGGKLPTREAVEV